MSQRACAVVSAGPIGLLSQLEVPDQEAGFVARSFRAHGGRREASRTRWNVNAGTREHEV